jgi:hypothetical protein
VTDRLSISKAWDETRARVAADGRLLTIVALALIALPAAIGEFLFPVTEEVRRGAWFARSPSSLGESLVMIVVAVIGIVGQLAIIRLALGPSLTVGEAISHGARRAPAYVGAALLMVLGVIILALPLVAIFVASGAELDPRADLPTAVVVAMILWFVLFLYLAVRMMMTSPVASAEKAGPVEIIKRSWRLTAGHWWRLFGFVMLFFIAIIILLSAVMLATNLAVSLWAGPVEPRSTAALIVALVEALVSALATTVFMVMLARVYVQLAGDRSGAPASVPSSGT